MSDPTNWKRVLIDKHKIDAGQLLEEVEQSGDLDLWEEMLGKMTDVILVRRRKGKPAPPHLFTFSDGITRNLSEMAFAHAATAVFPELEGDGCDE